MLPSSIKIPQNYKVSALGPLRGNIIVPGDKSISHRALLMGALAKSGISQIQNLLLGEDVLSTWSCLEKMGVRIEKKGSEVWVHALGFNGLKAPTTFLDCGNSGTTMRLLMGVLASCPWSSELRGDASLTARPMERVAKPLRSMGAQIELSMNHTAPVKIKGTHHLQAIEYCLPVASAQLKSALILAGLRAQGETQLTGLIASRDHTELMLQKLGVNISVSEESIGVNGGQSWVAQNLVVPGDFSSAAFWLTAATLVPDSDILVRNVSLNPTRSGLLRVLQNMGAPIEIEAVAGPGEIVGNLRVRYAAHLRATKIDSAEIPYMIDELPLLAILAARAQGLTRISGAEDLRIKESDRIEAIAQNLRAMGVVLKTFTDGFEIEGPQKFKGNVIHTQKDHRIAMAFSIAALIAEGASTVLDAESVAVSYPNFFEQLHSLSQ